MNLPARGFSGEAASADQGQVSRERLKAYLKTLVTILEATPPDKWWRAIYLFLRRTERSLEAARNFDPLLASYLSDRMQDVLEIFRDYKDAPVNRDEATAKEYASAAAHLIHDIAERLTPEQEPGEPLRIYRRSINEIVQAHPDKLRLEERPDADGKMRRYLLARADEQTPWQELPLPNRPGVLFKGGPARMLLKIALGTKPDMLRKEFPRNDIDVIVATNDTEGEKEAIILGADPAGIERVEVIFDLDTLLRGRDIDLNQCLLDGEHLIFTEGAKRACKTGCISICSEDRVLYGAETFYYGKEFLIKNRGLQRLIKFVVEGKAESFCFTPLNEHVDFGLYWLVLARKFAKKPNAGALLEKLYEVGKQCNQVYPGENTIYDVLDRVHKENPFFAVDSKELDDVGLVGWLVSKLGKTVDRDFRRRKGIEMDLKMPRTYGDQRPYPVHLYDFVADPAKEQATAAEWPRFVERCRQRSQQRP